MASQEGHAAGAAGPEGGGIPPVDPGEYDLKVDAQVEKFLELKHKLTFFLITAAVGSLGYTLDFAIEKMDVIKSRPLRVTCLTAATAVGLLAVMFALFSLYNEISSYRFHIKYRYARMTFEQASADDQAAWNRANRFAKRFERASFLCLVISVTLQAALFLLFLV